MLRLLFFIHFFWLFSSNVLYSRGVSFIQWQLKKLLDFIQLGIEDVFRHGAKGFSYCKEP